MHIHTLGGSVAHSTELWGYGCRPSFRINNSAYDGSTHPQKIILFMYLRWSVVLSVHRTPTTVALSALESTPHFLATFLVKHLRDVRAYVAYLSDFRRLTLLLDFRMTLNNYLQRNPALGSVEYRQTSTGPGNAVTWTVIAYCEMIRCFPRLTPRLIVPIVKGVEYGRGTASTVGAAKELAAQQVLRALESHH